MRARAPMAHVRHRMRCIAHIDMDCFYAQVEANRLGIDCRHTPFILEQWGNLIAVNYPARACGIQRFTSLQEARERCPNVVVSGVATYRMGETEYKYHPHPNKQTHKVALEPYREASRQIFRVLCSFDHVGVEKGSVDEAYLDVTEAARRELAALKAETAARGAELDALTDVLEPSTRLIEDSRAEMEAWCAARGTSMRRVYDGPMAALKRHEVRSEVGGSRAYAPPADMRSPAEEAEYAENTLLLCAASRVVRRVRQRICDQLHFDCSAGIAHNRLLAKSISARHKPNQQSLLLPDRAASALFDVPLSKLNGFGGKLGKAVKAVCAAAARAEVELCRDVWLTPLAQLARMGNGYGEVAEDLKDTTGSDEEDTATGSSASSNNSSEEDEGPASSPPTAGQLSTSSMKRMRRTAMQEPVENEAQTTAQYVFYRVRGFATDTIAQRSMTKMLMASKAFRPSTNDLDVVRRWVIVLASELSSRYHDFTQLYNVVGQNLNLKLGDGGLSRIGSVLNRTMALPGVVTTDSLVSVVMQEVHVAMHLLRVPAPQRYTTASSAAASTSNMKSEEPPQMIERLPLLVNCVTLTIGRFTHVAANEPGQRTLTSFTLAKPSEMKAGEGADDHGAPRQTMLGAKREAKTTERDAQGSRRGSPDPSRCPSEEVISNTPTTNTTLKRSISTSSGGVSVVIEEEGSRRNDNNQHQQHQQQLAVGSAVRRGRGRPRKNALPLGNKAASVAESSSSRRRDEDGTPSVLTALHAAAARARATRASNSPSAPVIVSQSPPPPPPAQQKEEGKARRGRGRPRKQQQPLPSLALVQQTRTSSQPSRKRGRKDETAVAEEADATATAKTDGEESEDGVVVII